MPYSAQLRLSTLPPETSTSRVSPPKARARAVAAMAAVARATEATSEGRARAVTVEEKAEGAASPVVKRRPNPNPNPNQAFEPHAVGPLALTPALARALGGETREVLVSGGKVRRRSWAE